MLSNFVVTFDATDAQINIIRQFCRNKIDCEYWISVRQAITEDSVLSVSMFANKPDLYIGIYSSKDDEIIENIQIDDETLKRALESLDLKYAHAMTRKSPVVNGKLALAWIKYYNANISNKNVMKYPIQTE